MNKRLLLWITGTAFVLLSAAAGAGWLYGLDVYVTRFAQGYSSGFLDIIGGFFSFLGGLEVTGFLLAALSAGLYARGRGRLAVRLLLAFLAAGVIEYLLKTFLPVPPVPGMLVRAEDFAPVSTMGLTHPYPSGHALRSVIIFGAVFSLSGSKIVRAATLLALAGLATSRVYLGAHWASDVVGGVLLGLVALLWAFGKEDKGWRSR